MFADLPVSGGSSSKLITQVGVVSMIVLSGGSKLPVRNRLLFIVQLI